MKRPFVELAGTGRYVPEKVLSNADLERMVDTSDDWIRERTGIRQRRPAPEVLRVILVGRREQPRGVSDENHGQ